MESTVGNFSGAEKRNSYCFFKTHWKIFSLRPPDTATLSHINSNINAVTSTPVRVMGSGQGGATTG